MRAVRDRAREANSSSGFLSLSPKLGFAMRRMQMPRRPGTMRKTAPGPVSNPRPRGAVCDSLSSLLQDLGHHVQSVRDGEQALELAQRWQPDFVLLDIHMPKRNGFMVARALRARFSSEQMKLVMMSGDNLDDTILAGAKAAGFDTCIDKVFAFSELEKLLVSATTG